MKSIDNIFLQVKLYVRHSTKGFGQSLKILKIFKGFMHKSFIFDGIVPNKRLCLYVKRGGDGEVVEKRTRGWVGGGVYCVRIFLQMSISRASARI